MIRLFAQCVSGVLCAVLLSSQVFSLSAEAQEPNSSGSSENAQCASLLSQGKGPNDLTSEQLMEIALEEHKLEELIDPNPEHNLAMLSPSLMMNAFQRAYAQVMLYKYKIAHLPNNRGSFLVYPMFSEGVPEAGGRMLIGNYEQVQDFVAFLRSGASGDSSARQLFLWEGAPGTGKTEFMTIVSTFSKVLSATNRLFARYTHEFINLEGIPELAHIPAATPVDDKLHFHPAGCPQNDSPYTLLPTKFQASLLEKTRAVVAKLLGRIKGRPVHESCDRCKDFRNKILTHYAKKLGKSKLSPEEEVQFLSQHVRIKRIVDGTGMGTKIDAEASDVDYPAMFGSANPLINAQFGPSNPHSTFGNGKLAQGHGSFLFFDEALRNDPKLLASFLALFEEGRISKGAINLKIDAIYLGAVNRETLQEFRANIANRALVDRMTKRPLLWPTEPFEIGKTQLLMKGRALWTRDLGQAETEFKQRPLNELITIPYNGNQLSTDGRYELKIENGEMDIHISPHTILYMASVVAATRMVTDEAEASKLGDYKDILSLPHFTDPVVRLKWLLGDIPSLEATKEKQLHELAQEIGEGNKGLSSRNLSGIWFTALIEEAYHRAIIAGKSEGYITPEMAQERLEQLLRSDSIEHDNYNPELRQKWNSLSKRILNEIFVRKIARDFTNGIDVSIPVDQIAEKLYDRIILELLALKADSRATKYDDHIGSETIVRQIQEERLEAIRKFYQDRNRVALDADQVLFLTEHQNTPTQGGTVPATPTQTRHAALLEAVREYVVSKKIEISGLLSELKMGSADVNQLPEAALMNLREKYGYSAEEAAKLFEWIRTKPYNLRNQ